MIVNLVETEITNSDQDFTDVIDRFTIVYSQSKSRPKNANVPHYISQLQNILDNFKIEEDDLGISSDVAGKLSGIISNMSFYYKGGKY